MAGACALIFVGASYLNEFFRGVLMNDGLRDSQGQLEHPADHDSVPLLFQSY
jgi:hypothetical protein